MNAPRRELTYAQAIQEALATAMEADKRVFIMGEDVGVFLSLIHISETTRPY